MTGEQQEFWSVTTILGGAIPKPQLVNWASKITAEGAYDRVDILKAYERDGRRDEAVKLLTGLRYDTMKAAQVRGTELHRIAESWALGAPIQVTDDLEPYIQQFTRFLETHTPTYELAEAPVYNLEYRYAGTLDAIVTLAGQRCVLDIKTTPKSPGNGARPPYPETALQLCAYAHCTHVGLLAAVREEGRYGQRFYVVNDDVELAPMPHVDAAYCLVLSPVDYQLVPARIDEQVWATFLHAREVFRWTNDLSKTALGAPVEKQVA